MMNKINSVVAGLIILISFPVACGKATEENINPDTVYNQTEKDSVIKYEDIKKTGKFDTDIIADSIKRSNKVYETDSVLIYRDTSYNLNIGEDVKLTVNIYITVDLRESGIREKITKIELLDKQNKIFQIINSNDSEWFASVETGDFNFDGYKDFYIYDGCVILDNCHGPVMLYDKSVNNFIREKEFDDLTSVTLYPDKKLLSSTDRAAAGAEFTFRLYKYINSELTLIDEGQQRIENNGKTKSDMYRYIRKKRDLKTDKMKVIVNQLSKEAKLEGGILDDY